MRIWLRATGIAIVCIAMLLVILPWVCGRIVQHELAIWLDSFDAPSYAFKLQNYQRGWFKSKIKLQLLIKNKHFLARIHDKGTMATPLNLKLTLHHGPLLYFYDHRKKFPVTFGLAYGHSKLVMPADASYAKYSSSRKIAVVRLLFRFDGVIKMRWVSHAFSFKHPKHHTVFSWKNLKLSNKFTPKGMEITRKISFDSLHYQNPLLNVTFGPANAEQYQTIGLHKVQAGDYRFDVAHMALAIEGLPIIHFKGLITQYHRELLHHVTNSVFNLWAKEVLVDDKQFGPANLGLVVDNLNTQALAQFNELIIDYYRHPPHTDEQEHAFYQRFRTLLPVLLNHGFQLRANPVEITLPSGVLSMNVMVTFPNFHHRPVHDLLRMYRRAEMNLQFILPKPFLKRVLNNYFQVEKQEEGNEQAASQTAQVVDKLIASWRSSGMLQSNKGDYYFSLTYKRGQVFVNSVPLMLKGSSIHGVLN